MEELIPIATFVTAIGVIITAIYNARHNTEKTLQNHIDRLDAKVKRLEVDIEMWESRYRELEELYNKERKRGDRLERRISELTKRKAL